MIKLKKIFETSYYNFLKPFSPPHAKSIINHRKSFYILFSFLIFSFSLLISCGGKNNAFNSGYSSMCSDYIVDVRPEYSDQTPGQSVNANVQGDRLGPIVKGGEINITGNTIRLELFFSLRQHSNSPALLQVMGIGTSRNFQGEFGITLGPFSSPLGLGIEEHPSDTISQVVREAIRNGYERLRESLGEQGALGQQQLTSTISIVQNNRIQIPLGRSDYVQDGDVFYIYPGGGYNNNYNNCNNITRSGPSLATATVIEIDQNESILEMGRVQNRQRSVQVGDIVELSQDTDFESRTQGRNNEPKPSTLRLGYISNIFITFRTDRSRFNDRYNNNRLNDGYSYGNDRITRRNITPLIRNFLLTEADDYNFRVIQ